MTTIEEDYPQLLTLTEKDIDSMIEYAVAQNMGGMNRSMLDDTLEDKIDYIVECELAGVLLDWYNEE